MSQTENLDVREVRAQDRAHVWHPMLQHRSLENRDLTVIREAKGTTLVDGEGRSYLDAYAGLWNVNVGYGREEIAEAVYDQMRRLPYYPNLQVTAPAAQLAARLAGILPGDLNHLFFCNSGSEATRRR